MNKIGILLLTIIILSWTKSYSCTNFLVTKGASTDGSTMITYSADSHTLYGELFYRPATDYPDGAMFDVADWDSGKPLGKIKQVKHTYSVVGNMNEFQVAIGETTFGGREELVDTTSLIDYGSLMFLALQRAKTAREAIKVMVELVTEYGYYSSGESFSISDPNEVWIMEMMGKGAGGKGAVWVAMRIPDGYISGHANYSRITTFPLENGKTSISSKNLKKIFEPAIEVVYALDVITFARTKNIFSKDKKDNEFNFANAYCPPDYGAIRFCDARVWSGFRRVNSQMDKYLSYIMGDSPERLPLWIKPDNKLSVHDVMELMRDHFEGTPLDMTQDVGAGPYKCPYRWRPMTWKYDSIDYLHERAISTQQTGFSFVAQSRSWLPNPIGGILWFGVDDTYLTVYCPMYCGITKVPPSYAEGVADMLHFSLKSAFWVFNFVSNWTYTRYSDMIVDVQKVQWELESKFIADVPNIDKKASDLYKTDPKQALAFITDYSVNEGEMTVGRWTMLAQYLIVKYMDGNVKPEKDGKFMTNGYTQAASPGHPAYPKDWYERIVKEKGPILLNKKLPEQK